MVYVYRPRSRARSKSAPVTARLQVTGTRRALGVDKEDSFNYGSDYYSKNSVAKREVAKRRVVEEREAMSPRKTPRRPRVVLKTPKIAPDIEAIDDGLRPAINDMARLGTETQDDSDAAPAPPRGILKDQRMTRSRIHSSVSTAPGSASSSPPGSPPKLNEVKVLSGLESIVQKLQEQADELKHHGTYARVVSSESKSGKQVTSSNVGVVKPLRHVRHMKSMNWWEDEFGGEMERQERPFVREGGLDQYAAEYSLSQLRAEESRLLAWKRRVEYERGRGPIKAWYELSGSNFNREHKRARRHARR